MTRRPLLYVCAALATINLPVVMAAPSPDSAGDADEPATMAEAPPRSAAAPATRATAASSVMAEVNNEKIMSADIERIVNAIRARESSLSTGSPEAQTALENIRQQILDNLITQRLLSQEARRQKITPAKKDVDEALSSIKGGASDAAFQQTLAGEGKTVADVRRIIGEELAIRELTKKLTADVAVSEADIKKFYNENAAEFKIPEAVRVRHILLAVKPDASASEREKIAARAQALFKRAQSSKSDFDKLARENSDDKGSRDQGGNLGFLMRQQVVKPFGDAAFTAPTGKVVGPVYSEFGYHIIRVEEKAPARTVPLSQVRERIEFHLLQKKNKERLEQRIAALRAQATIKKYN